LLLVASSFLVLQPLLLPTAMVRVVTCRLRPLPLLLVLLVVPVRSLPMSPLHVLGLVLGRGSTERHKQFEQNKLCFLPHSPLSFIYSSQTTVLK
jgi:hypothetical protein